MANPFEEFKRQFQQKKQADEFMDFFKSAVDKVGKERVQYDLQIINQLWDHFEPKYGAERAGMIISKIAVPPPVGWNVDRLIHAGERFHVMNLYFNKKITAEELRLGMEAADRLPH